MAYRRFAAVSGDWADAANWTEPVSSDDVMIDQSAIEIETGTDNNAVDLTTLKVTAGFTGDIGATGNPLKIGSARVDIAGGREVWLQGKTAVALDAIYIDRPAQFPYAVQLSSYFGNVYLTRGNLNIAGSSASDDAARELYLASTGRTDIGTSVTQLAQIYQSAGLVVCNSAVTRLDLGGGVWEQLLGTLTTLVVGAGGLFKFKTPGGTVTKAIVQPGGRFECTENLTQPTSTAPTVTTLIALPGSVVDLRTGVGNAVVTNPYYLKGANVIRDS